MRDILYSVGIDVGTTTSQVIFSRLTLENTAASSSVPKVKIVGREVFYESPISFTPLIDRNTIDADALRVLLEKEYAAAGVRASDISAGAVIITGEAAKKHNAENVLSSLTGLAGEFVVATAGSELESILAGRGAGTEQLSRERDGVVANLDIGGGTTNIAFFKNGNVLDVSCLDIGGRHVRVDRNSGLVKSISPQCRKLIQAMGLRIEEGAPADPAALRKLTDRCVELVAELLRVVPPSRDLPDFITYKDFQYTHRVDDVVFSGGVASAMLELEKKTPATEADLFRYGDMGICMAMSLRESVLYSKLHVLPARETIRATVIGAGVHVMELSGSTVFYSTSDRLPLKNIPILKISPDEEAAGNDSIAASIRAKLPWYQQDDGQRPVGVSLSGKANASYAYVLGLAGALAEGCRDAVRSTGVAVVIVENDLAKSLGNALHDQLGKWADIYCLDAIDVQHGDFIDIGRPVSGNRVLPVVIKSLLFGKGG